jgi:hypothetical protein
LDKFAQTVELYDPNRVLQSGDFSVRGIDWHETAAFAPPVLWTYKIRRTKFAMAMTPRLGSNARRRTNSIPVVRALENC